MKEQVNIHEVMQKISDNPDLYHLDLAIENLESHYDATRNQIKQMDRDCEKTFYMIQALKNLRKVAEENPPPKKAEFQKI